MYLEILDKMLSEFDSLKVNQELCVHTISPKATCQKCVETCPTKAISISEKIEIDETCTACGACAASCPEDVFEISNPSDKFLLENINKKPILTCRKNVEDMSESLPKKILVVTCLSRLYYELLFFMAFESLNPIYIWIDAVNCLNCINNKNISDLKETISNINKIFDKNKIIIVDKLPENSFENTSYVSQENSDRRDFFKNIYKNVTRASQKALISLLDEKLSESRKSLQETLKDLQSTKNKKRELLLNQIEKIPSENNLNLNIKLPIKKMEIKKCYMCEVCVKVCPNGALQSKEGTLYIDYKRCTNCDFCKDICINKSIKFTEQIDIAEIMENDIWELVKTTTHTCRNCGIEYRADSGIEFCLKCSLQEDFENKGG